MAVGEASVGTVEGNTVGEQVQQLGGALLLLLAEVVHGVQAFVEPHADKLQTGQLDVERSRRVSLLVLLKRPGLR